jgi:hypothetical protein
VVVIVLAMPVLLPIANGTDCPPIVTAVAVAMRNPLIVSDVPALTPHEGVTALTDGGPEVYVKAPGSVADPAGVVTVTSTAEPIALRPALGRLMTTLLSVAATMLACFCPTETAEAPARLAPVMVAVPPPFSCTVFGLIAVRVGAGATPWAVLEEDPENIREVTVSADDADSTPVLSSIENVTVPEQGSGPGPPLVTKVTVMPEKDEDEQVYRSHWN